MSARFTESGAEKNRAQRTSTFFMKKLANDLNRGFDPDWSSELDDLNEGTADDSGDT